jgi:XRE family transcriptional regulator, regulator of sulfur utilization
MTDADAGGLGRRLRQAREAHGWSMHELERRSGLKTSIISRLETGKQPGAHSETLKILAETLGVSIDYLLGVQRKQSPSVPTGTGCHHACPVPAV